MIDAEKMLANPIFEGKTISAALDHCLKQDPKTSSISVIMLTTEAQRSMIERARQSGAKAWLIKPVKMESLVSTVLKIAGAP